MLTNKEELSSKAEKTIYKKPFVLNQNVLFDIIRKNQVFFMEDI